MIIRVAKSEEYEAVMEFYYNLIDKIDKSESNSVGWIKGVYPHPDFVKSSIEKGEYYIGLLDDEIVSAMVLNHEANESYDDYDWPVKFTWDEMLGIHALGVSPDHKRKGLGKEMVKYSQNLVKEQGLKAIRLDVLHGNEAAMRLYSSCGFIHRHTLKMFYEDTGWTDFLLYEWIAE